MIKNSLINSTWTIDVLDATDVVLNSYTFNTQWLENFTDAIANGAGSPLGHKKFNAIKFGYGQSPSITGMIGIENLVALTTPSWPVTDDLNLTHNTTYNVTSGFYTKTTTETGTLLVGVANDITPGTVITEVGGAYSYNYDPAKYTDGIDMDPSWLDTEYLSNLYSQVQARYNPLCATRGLIVDGSGNPVSITLLDGQKLRYTIVTTLEFKAAASRSSGAVVTDESSGNAIDTVVTVTLIPYNDPTSYLGNAALGDFYSFPSYATMKAISSTADTASYNIPFVYNYTDSSFIVDVNNQSLPTGSLTDIQYIDITDDGYAGDDELTLARITFDPPVPAVSAIELDLNLSCFAEPKFATTPGTLPNPVFEADPDLVLFPDWNLAKTVFPGKELRVVTDKTSRTITLIHNSSQYTYSYASGANAGTAAIDLDISANVPVIMTPDEYTIGYFAPIADDATYYINGEPFNDTTVSMTLRDSTNVNNFVMQEITLDITRPAYNPASTGPFLALGVSGGSQKVVCTDLSNYSLVPAAEGITDNPVVIAYSPDGTKVAIGFDIAPYFRVFDANTWAPIPDAIPTISGYVNDLTFSPDGTKLCIAHNGFGNYTVLNTADWTSFSRPSVTSQCMTAKFSNDGNYLALGHTAGKRISVVNLNTWTLVAGLPTLPGVCVTVDWNTDDSRLACGHYLGGFLTVLDTSTWTAISGPVSDGNIPALEYSADGSTLAIMNGLQLKILSTIDWSTLHTIQLPGEGYDLQYNPDGTLLGVMHMQGNILSLFNTTTWTALPDSTWLDGYSPRTLCFRPIAP